MPTKYGDSKYYLPIQAKLNNIYDATSNFPWFFKLPATVIANATREDLRDIVVTYTNGVLVPRQVIGSKTSGIGVVVYRDPIQDPLTGGTQVYLQYGGATVTVVNDSTTFRTCFDGSIDYDLALIPGDDTVLDRTSNGLVGTLEGNTGLPAITNGAVHKGYSFTAENGHRIKYNDNAILDGHTSGLTIAVLAQQSITGAYRGFAYKYNTNQIAYGFALRDDNKVAEIVSANGSVVDSFVSTSAFTGTTNYRLYALHWATGQRVSSTVNGVNEAGTSSGSIANSVFNSTSPLYLGAYLGASQFWGGVINLAFIIRGTVSANKLKSMYENFNAYATNGALVVGVETEFSVNNSVRGGRFGQFGFRGKSNLRQPFSPFR